MSVVLPWSMWAMIEKLRMLFMEGEKPQSTQRTRRDDESTDHSNPAPQGLFLCVLCDLCGSGRRSIGPGRPTTTRSSRGRDRKRPRPFSSRRQAGSSGRADRRRARRGRETRPWAFSASGQARTTATLPLMKARRNSSRGLARGRLPVRERVLHLDARGHGRGDLEEPGQALLEELAQDPVPALLGPVLVEHGPGIEHAGVAPAHGVAHRRRAGLACRSRSALFRLEHAARL